MVGRYIIEDEYTINVKLERGANSPLPSYSSECSFPSKLLLSGGVVGCDEGGSFIFKYKYPDPVVSFTRGADKLRGATLQATSPHAPHLFTLVTRSNSHTTTDGTHFGNEVPPQRANLFVVNGENGERNSVREIACEGKQPQPFMGEVRNSALASRRLSIRRRIADYASVTERSSIPKKGGDWGGSSSNVPASPVVEERKQSKVKMMVVSSGNCKSPAFKPVSGFAPLHSPDEGNRSPFMDLQPLRLISSFGEVIPLKPAEGFVFLSQPMKEDPEPCFYTEHTAIVHSPAEKNKKFVHFALPSVKVFDEDNTLVSKNTYASPKGLLAKDKTGLLAQPKRADPDSQTSSRRTDDPTRSDHPRTGLITSYPRTDQSPKPRGPGSLFVKPIRQHCATGSGELYVAPVDASIINASKGTAAPTLKGNSRRKKEKVGVQVTTRSSDQSGSHIFIHKAVQTPAKTEGWGFRITCDQTRTKPDPSGVMPFPSSTFQREEPIFRDEVGQSLISQISAQNARKGSTHSSCASNATSPAQKEQQRWQPQKKVPYYSQSSKEFPLTRSPLSSFDGSGPLKKSPFFFKSTSSMPQRVSSSRHQSRLPKECLLPSLPTKCLSLHLPNIPTTYPGSSSKTSIPNEYAPRISSVHDKPTASFKLAARAHLAEVLATKMSSVPFYNGSRRSFPLHKSQTTSFIDRQLKTEAMDAANRRSYKKNVVFCFSSKPPTTTINRRDSNQNGHHPFRFGEGPQKDRKSSLFLPSDRRKESLSNVSKGGRTLGFPTPAGDCVPDVYTSGPTTLTPSGHDTHEESSSSTDPSYFNPRDLESRSETMLVTNEPLSAPHLPLTPSHHFSSSNIIINSNLRGNPRAAKYLVDDQVSIPPPSPMFEGCENFAFDSSFGQDNPAFESTFAYLPFGDSRSLDPGYGSEKSEEEGREGGQDEVDDEDEDNVDESGSSSDEESNLRHSFLEPPQGIRLDVEYLMKIFPFINEGTMFDVTIVKNSRGLGLALTGGVECESGLLPGLIRIRKLYPQTPAWLCGQLEVNDFILEANERQLTGLTSHEALEVLRTAGGEVHLVLCRAPEEVLNASEESSPADAKESDVVSTSLTAPQPIFGGHFLSPSPSFTTCGEFEIHLRKVSGSLGFTLRKNDNSILGHTIRSLVKEPAISDGRLRPGDKLLSVNGTDMCGLSHEEAVQFLRTCPESVVIRIYRDAMQTPVSPASPTEPEFSKPKALRQEARDMLTDLAFRKQSSPHPSGNPHSDTPTTPRRRRLNKNSSPESKEERWESLVREVEASSVQCAFVDTTDSREVSPFDNSHSDTLTAASTRSGTINSQSSSNNSYKELSVIASSHSPSNSSCSESRPRRPNFLDLNSSHSSSKKSQFTPPYEEFPSPPVAGRQCDSLNSAPQLTSAHSDTPAFSHLQTCYRSVNAASSLAPFAEQRLTNTSSDHNISRHGQDSESPHKKNALLKWKGVVFTPEEEEAEEKENFITNSSFNTSISPPSHESRVVTLELTRGWNSRLGFSLQNSGNDTTVVAIYADSLAAKDGRLNIGDIILEVNGNDVRSWDAQNVIELLRKTRGKICLKILQKQT